MTEPLTLERLDELEKLIRRHAKFLATCGMRSTNLLALIAMARSAVWRDISEAPKDGTEILVYWAEQEHVLTAQWIDLLDGEGPNWYAGIDYLPADQLAHFMPLPAPPQRESDE